MRFVNSEARPQRQAVTMAHPGVDHPPRRLRECSAGVAEPLCDPCDPSGDQITASPTTDYFRSLLGQILVTLVSQ